MSLTVGDEIELKVTPDPYLTVRYAGASGDYNPIHVDEEFARNVGLPGRILHGLWTMAQVARAHTSAAGGPEALRSLSVEFRGVGVMGEPITIRGSVVALVAGGALVESEAEQGGRKIIRGGRAELVAAPRQPGG